MSELLRYEEKALAFLEVGLGVDGYPAVILDLGSVSQVIRYRYPAPVVNLDSLSR